MSWVSRGYVEELDDGLGEQLLLLLFVGFFEYFVVVDHENADFGVVRVHDEQLAGVLLDCQAVHLGVLGFARLPFGCADSSAWSAASPC